MCAGTIEGDQVTPSLRAKWFYSRDRLFLPGSYVSLLGEKASLSFFGIMKQVIIPLREVYKYYPLYSTVKKYFRDG